MQVESYNIRVYGLYFRNEYEVLVTDEIRNGYQMTKFPGGGHDKGEGIADCLKREWREEMGAEIEVGELFYLNDFLQISAFDPRDQLLSIYYKVNGVSQLPSSMAIERFDFPAGARNAQTFRWLDLRTCGTEEFTFPVDREVVRRLQAAFQQS